MSDLTIDLTNYKDRVGGRVPPGRYRVAVDDAERTESRTGNTMVVLWFRIVDGEFANSTVIDRLVLTENSLFRVVAFMQALGIPTPRKRFNVNLKQFIGKQLDVDIDDGEPYNGRVKSEVRGYMRAEARNGAAPSDTEFSADGDLPGNGSGPYSDGQDIDLDEVGDL